MAGWEEGTTQEVSCVGARRQGWTQAAHGRAVETTGCLVQVFSDGVKPYVTPTVRS